MEIEILGSESLGVRGLCCFVRLRDRKILIDPGIALGYMRHHLLPHPFQVAVAERIKKRILARWKIATDIVISHFHGDHVPLADANPYQLSIKQVVGLNPEARIWSKPMEALSPREKQRAADFSFILGVKLTADPCGEGGMTFSKPVLHGDKDSSDTVMMTRIAEDRVFVHASDIQLLNDEAVSRVLTWEPDVALIDGPPLYLSKLSERQIRNAWDNALALARGIGTLILDHHLMRDMEGVAWLERLTRETGRRVLCSADFMRRPRMLLEADRERLYTDMPVPKDWHEVYKKTRTGGDVYWDLAQTLHKEWFADGPCP